MSVVQFNKGQFYLGSNLLSAKETYALYSMGAARFGASSSKSSTDSNTCGICFDAVVAEKCSWACSTKKHKYCKECTQKVLKQNFANRCPECRAMPLDTAHHRSDTGLAWLMEQGPEREIHNETRGRKSDIIKMVLYLATVGAMILGPTKQERKSTLVPFDNQMSGYTRDWPQATGLVEWEPEKGKGRARSKYTRQDEGMRKAKNREDRERRKMNNYIRHSKRLRKQGECKWYQAPKDTLDEIDESGFWACPKPLTTPLKGLVKYR